MRSECKVCAQKFEDHCKLHNGSVNSVTECKFWEEGRAVKPKRGRPTKSEAFHKEKERERQINVINDRFTDNENLPYNKSRIEGELQYLSGMVGMTIVAMGRRLILLKENEPHGEFLESLKRVEIEPRSAQRLMKCAVTAQKMGKSDTVSYLGIRKLVELATLDDEELAELGEGGTVYGLTLDKVDTMTHRELREQLRETKEQLETKEESYTKILEEKDRKLNELELKATFQTEAEKWSEEVQSLMSESAGIMVTANLELDKLYDIIEKLKAKENSEYRAEHSSLGSHCGFVFDSIAAKLDEVEHALSGIVIPEKVILYGNHWEIEQLKERDRYKRVKR